MESWQSSLLRPVQACEERTGEQNEAKMGCYRSTLSTIQLPLSDTAVKTWTPLRFVGSCPSWLLKKCLLPGPWQPRDLRVPVCVCHKLLIFLADILTLHPLSSYLYESMCC